MEVVKFHLNTTAALAVIAISLASGSNHQSLPGMSRLSPAALLVMAALLGRALRGSARKQKARGNPEISPSASTGA